MEALETKERSKRRVEGHEGDTPPRLRIGLLIAGLAALLALMETGGKLLVLKQSTRICKRPIFGPSSKRKQLG